MEKSIREHTVNHLDFTFLLFILNQNKLTPEDIDITPREVEELRSQVCRVVAENLLDELRKGDSDYEKTIELLKGNLNGCKLSLTSIGSSDEEIRELELKGAKAKAAKMLKDLRKVASDPGGRFIRYQVEGSYKHLVSQIGSELARCNKTLEDIGSSKEELDNLTLQASKDEAKSYLSILGKGSTEDKPEHDSDSLIFWINKLLQELNRNNFTLEDVASSEEEVLQLTSVKIYRDGKRYRIDYGDENVL